MHPARSTSAFQANAAAVVTSGDVAALLLRMFTAFVLIYGTQDNVMSGERMGEFAGFLAQHRFPWPTASAHLSAYAQFVGGLFLALGFMTRWVGFVMVVNFIVALAMVHVGQPFQVNIAPLAMLANAVYFAIAGAPALSVDAWRASRSRPGTR